MPNEKFDKSHISKDENEEMVKMIVDELMAEELMDNPFDFFFRSSSDYFPNACHEVLELPGIFEKKLNSSIFSFTGRSLQADYIEKVLPDNKMIFDPAIIIVDHMSYKLDVDKIDSSFEYKMQCRQVKIFSYFFLPFSDLIFSNSFFFRKLVCILLCILV